MIDERDLARRATQGDEDAFASLVRAHVERAHRVAYVIVRSASDADDAVQDGVVKAWRNLHRYDPDRPFGPWLTAIVANTARNIVRSSSRREALRLRASVDPPAPGPDDEALSRLGDEQIVQQLESLPERYRRAVALRHVVGLSEAETAAALGVRSGTVKSRVSRGLARLRAALEEAS